ncbi:hypothetical protein GE300_02455 [Rhodobacteraceae bacterium 2CG4]|uniref:DUF2946 family protein n=1 Tax=Halovulum marinum TaxID=2662447 RepID=A0A6L5YW65_9RHOB|nr:hypothetical protein [Halovulum marinum]MSU88478.1 hypothetical protein [Halovulum marinum]
MGLFRAVVLVLYVAFSAMATAGIEDVPGVHQDHAAAVSLDGSARVATAGHDLRESHCHSELDCFLTALAPDPLFRMSRLAQRERKVWPEERHGSIAFSPRLPPPRPSAET